MTKAPWTLSQVLSLKQYQDCGLFHEYTSGRGVVLTPTELGWRERPDGPVVQDWAMTGHTDWSWAREDAVTTTMLTINRASTAKKQAALALLVMRNQYPRDQWEQAVKDLLGEK